MHIKMHISCRNRKQYEQRNCKTIHTQSIHRKGTVPIPPTDESAGFLGTFFIETVLLIDQWKDQKALDAHHASPMMKQLAQLRDKYDLHMRVERMETIDDLASDHVFIRQ